LIADDQDCLLAVTKNHFDSVIKFEAAESRTYRIDSLDEHNQAKLPISGSDAMGWGGCGDQIVARKLGPSLSPELPNLKHK
jgi:hypothetical protein